MRLIVLTPGWKIPLRMCSRHAEVLYTKGRGCGGAMASSAAGAEGERQPTSRKEEAAAENVMEQEA